jgi:hypothetical protein
VKSTVVFILKLITVIALTPLLAPLFLFNAIYGFQLLYVASFQIVNQTSWPLWITPVGTYGSGKKHLLRLFIAAFPALDALRQKNHRIKPGRSKRIHFDRRGLGYYEVVVRNSEGEYRQLILEPVPSKVNCYRLNDSRFVIENWDSLAPVSDDVLTAALEASKGWMMWMLILIGFSMLYFYSWLMESWLCTSK